MALDTYNGFVITSRTELDESVLSTLNQNFEGLGVKFSISTKDKQDVFEIRYDWSKLAGIREQLA